MTSRISKLTAAGIVIAGVVLFALFDSFTQPAWALEDAIKAVKDYRAIHVVGTLPGGTAEVWMRANQAHERTRRMWSCGAAPARSPGREDGSTYHYEPGQNTVYFESLTLTRRDPMARPGAVGDARCRRRCERAHGKDPATGRDRVTLLCSLIDVHGPQSWAVEFDAASRLPVTVKQWPNLDRSGTPSFDAFRITYYEDLSDNIFDVRIPGDPAYVEKPLQDPRRQH